jgi:molecular chaperone HtpG
MNAVVPPSGTASPRTVDIAPGQVRLGKDVLELLSTAMYVDPLVVFRELVQNAADSIDSARAGGLLEASAGHIEVLIDPAARSVRVRDDGQALATDDFLTRMVSLGGSEKRGTWARGFRGVGRLAALGHAQELVFRSRAPGSAEVGEIRWDVRALRTALADQTFAGDVADLMSRVVSATVRPARGAEDAARFFEVELVRIPRGRSDKLLSLGNVADYLSQVAPAPFHPDFRWGRDILDELKPFPAFSEVRISVNEVDVYRPHRNTIDFGGRQCEFERPQFRTIPTHDGSDIAAVAWFMHHSYEGALPNDTLVKGVRLRVGNLQVGDGAILEGLFPETRFNSWSVGEVHIFDQRLAPNGRRDQFEQNAHYANLLTHLVPLTRDIAQRCRTYSTRRSKLREFEVVAASIRERLDVIAQGGLDASARRLAVASIEAAVQRLQKLAAMPLLTGEAGRLHSLIDHLGKDLAGAAETDAAGDPLAHLAPEEQAFFRRMVSMIYAHSINRTAAKALVDRILEKELKAASA